MLGSSHGPQGPKTQRHQLQSQQFDPAPYHPPFISYNPISNPPQYYNHPVHLPPRPPGQLFPHQFSPLPSFNQIYTNVSQSQRIPIQTQYQTTQLFPLTNKTGYFQTQQDARRFQQPPNPPLPKKKPEFQPLRRTEQTSRDSRVSNPSSAINLEEYIDFQGDEATECKCRQEPQFQLVQEGQSKWKNCGSWC